MLCRGAGAANRDAVGAQCQHAVERVLAGRYLDHGAGLGVEELLLQLLLEGAVGG